MRDLLECLGSLLSPRGLDGPWVPLKGGGSGGPWVPMKRRGFGWTLVYFEGELDWSLASVSFAERKRPAKLHAGRYFVYIDILTEDAEISQSMGKLFDTKE